MVTHTRKVFYTTTAHQHDRVLLQVVTISGDISNNLHFVGEANLGHITQRRVRLLKRSGINTGANSTAERTAIQSPGLTFGLNDLSSFSYQLLNCRHSE